MTHRGRRNGKAPCGVCGAECYGENEAHIVVGDGGGVLAAFCGTCWPLVRLRLERVSVVIDHARWN